MSTFPIHLARTVGALLCMCVQTNSDSGLAPTYSCSLLRAMPTNEAEWFGVSPMIAASTSAMFCDVLAEISTAPIQLAHSADVRSSVGTAHRPRL